MIIPLRANLFDKLIGAFAIRRKGSGISTTLSAAIAAGATTLPLTATTSTADKKIVFIGSGDDLEALVENGAASGSNITAFTGSKRGHDALETVVEGVAYDLGDVSQMRGMDSSERGDIVNDVDRSPSSSRLGYLGYGTGGRFQSIDMQHMALALGVPFSNILGAESAADPLQLTTDGDEIGREPTSFVIAALDEDGNTIYQELEACDADYTNVRLPLSQGPETGLDVGFYARMHPRVIKGAINFVADVSKRILPGHYPESLQDSGFFEVKSGGLSAVLTAATTVGGNTMALDVATGVAGGKWYVVAYGRYAQIIWVESLATLTATCRIRFKYIFPIGATVTEVEIIRPGGSRQGSTEFSIGGTIRKVQFDNARVVAGHRPGTARFALGFAPTRFNLDTFRRRHGLPASSMTSTVLTYSDLAGSSAPVGCFAKVQRKDGKTWWAILTTAENTLEDLSLSWTQSEMWSVNLKHIAKRVTFLQY